MFVVRKKDENCTVCVRGRERERERERETAWAAHWAVGLRARKFSLVALGASLPSLPSPPPPDARELAIPIVMHDVAVDDSNGEGIEGEEERRQAGREGGGTSPENATTKSRVEKVCPK